MSDDVAFDALALYHKDNVIVRYMENHAGGGVTPSGLIVEHSLGLPPCFGEVVALGPRAREAGIYKDQHVLFTRYAGEVIERLDDGSAFAVFHYDDLRGEYRR